MTQEGPRKSRIQIAICFLLGIKAHLSRWPRPRNGKEKLRLPPALRQRKHTFLIISLTLMPSKAPGTSKQLVKSGLLRASKAATFQQIDPTCSPNGRPLPSRRRSSKANTSSIMHLKSLRSRNATPSECAELGHDGHTSVARHSDLLWVGGIARG